MIIEIEGLSKNYGDVQALNNINLRIDKGGVIGLLGPNGAGKTTLVETVEGLRRPSSGKISVLGLDPIRNAQEVRERIGVQLQSTALPPELSPLETLRMFGAFFHTSLPAVELIERVGLASKADARNSTLSGGQQRRLAIAIAMVNDPELIILDEPTSGLDPVARREIHARIAALRGSTVLLTTHYIEEAEQLCDRVILLRGGEIVADGSPFELISRARGTTSLWLAVEGEFDPTPLLRAGAVEQGRQGEYYRFATTDPRAMILALAEMLHNKRVSLVDLRMKRPNLEDVYLELVGSDLSAESEDA